MMTEQTSIETLNVKLSTIMESRREDLDDRRGDKERRDRERLEDRRTMRELTNSMSEMARNVTEHKKLSEFLVIRMENLEEEQKSQGADVKVLNNVQSGNKVRWQVVVSVVVICASLIVALATSGLSSKNSTSALEQQSKVIEELARSTNATSENMATITEIMINTYSKSKEGE